MSASSRDLDALLDGSATDLAAAIARDEVSSEAVTRACLDRIAAANPRLNAFVTVGPRRAIAAARRRDRQRARGLPLPPFHGVPTGIKDLNLTREFATRFGSRGVRAAMIPIDDRLTARIRAAGFVIVGKLATAEVGALPVTEPEHHGPTLTPYGRHDDPRAAGGSSGGSGSAVAAGLVPIAPGSDGAGSVRIPSAFNGLVGIKPSRGRIAPAYPMPDATTMVSDGPLARSVGDAAALLDAMAGLSFGTPWWAPAPARRFALEVGAPVRKLRVRVSLTHALAPTEPDVAAAVGDIARRLAAAGHDVRDAAWSSIELDEFLPIWQFAVAKTRYLVGDAGVAPSTRWLRQRGHGLTAHAIEGLKASLSERLRTWFGDADLWLSPTVCRTAPPVGLAQGADGEAAFRRAAPLGGFTAPFNLTGQPALSLPVGLDRQGLPIGVQLAGRMFDDATLIAVAAALEAALPPWLRAPR